jgi:hypothetical protein
MRLPPPGVLERIVLALAILVAVIQVAVLVLR